MMDLAAAAILGADFDFFKAGQDIELGERDAGHAVDPDRVAHADRVEPAAAARSPGGGAELVAFLLEPFSLGALQLRRERSAADARRVGLREADDFMDAPRA